MKLSRTSLVNAVRKSRKLDKIQEVVETKFRKGLQKYKEEYFKKQESKQCNKSTNTMN